MAQARLQPRLDVGDGLVVAHLAPGLGLVALVGARGHAPERVEEEVASGTPSRLPEHFRWSLRYASAASRTNCSSLS